MHFKELEMKVTFIIISLLLCAAAPSASASANLKVISCDSCSNAQKVQIAEHTLLWQGQIPLNCQTKVNKEQCEVELQHYRVIVIDAITNTYTAFAAEVTPYTANLLSTTPSTAESNIAQSALNYRHGIFEIFQQVEKDYQNDFSAYGNSTLADESRLSTKTNTSMKNETTPKSCTFTNNNGKLITIQSSTGLLSLTAYSIWDYLRSDAIMTHIKNKIEKSLNHHYKKLAYAEAVEFNLALSGENVPLVNKQQIFSQFQQNTASLYNGNSNQILSFDVKTYRAPLSKEPFNDASFALNKKTSKDWEGVSIIDRLTSRDKYFKSQCNWDEFKDYLDRDGKMQLAENEKLSRDWEKVSNDIDLDKCQKNISLKRKRDFLGYQDISYRDHEGSGEFEGKPIYDEYFILSELDDEECQN